MGSWILLDEINAALPEVLFVIQALAESNHGKLGDILLAEKDGEIVTPHPDCRLFGTANPADKYVGTKEFNPATLSRFLMLEIQVLPQEEEKKLLHNKFPSMSLGMIQKLSEIGLRIRQKYASEEIAYFCSTRDLVYMAELINKGLADTDAFEVVIMNKVQTKIEKEIITRAIDASIKMPIAKYDAFV
jgi:midasin (ATPase involved in ribosome maturation)